MPVRFDLPQGEFLSGPDYCALPSDPNPWLLRPLVPVGGWVNIYGKPKKARKSYLALGMAWAVSSGQSHWLSFEVLKSGPVLYLQADTPRNLWKQRVDDIGTAYDFSQVYFADIQTLAERNAYPFNVGTHADILAEMIVEVEQKAGAAPVLIALDTARKLHTGDENSSQDTTLFMNSFEEACGPEMAKILVSHDKKGGALDPKQEDDDPNDAVDLMEGARGSTAIAGAVDTVIKMTPKGYMWYQGRAVGEERKRLKFSHVHEEGGCPHVNKRDCMGWMWEEDTPPEIARARELLETFAQASERSLGRILAKQFDKDEEWGRAIVRAQKRRS